MEKQRKFLSFTGNLEAYLNTGGMKFIGDN
jgi:hypothetical protein